MPDALPQLSEECFFIAPIGADGSQERERSDGVLEVIVGAAARELGLTAVRADQIADPGQITLQVIDHILNARAAVADLTGLNANVFYELAVRHTARLPVALIAEKSCTLPFDIAQMRTIFFESTNLRSADQCRREIVVQLKQALNGAAVDSPIATSIDVRALAGGSVVERNVAEMVTAVEEIAKSQRSLMQRIEQMDRRQRAQHNEIRATNEGRAQLLRQEARVAQLQEKLSALTVEIVRHQANKDRIERHLSKAGSEMTNDLRKELSALTEESDMLKETEIGLRAEYEQARRIIAKLQVDLSRAEYSDPSNDARQAEETSG